MKTIKDIIISTSEPSINSVAWLQPQSNNIYKLFIYGNNGWTPLSSSGEEGSNIQTEFIEEIPNIIINK